MNQKLRMFIFGWKMEDFHPDFRMIYPYRRLLPIMRQLFPDQMFSPRMQMIMTAQLKYEIMKEHFWSKFTEGELSGNEKKRVCN